MYFILTVLSFFLIVLSSVNLLLAYLTCFCSVWLRLGCLVVNTPKVHPGTISGQRQG